MKMLLAMMLLATPALAQDRGDDDTEAVCDGTEGAKRVLSHKPSDYQRYIDDFKFSARPSHGGDSGMVNVFPAGGYGAVEPIGALVISSHGYTHNWLRTTASMSDHIPHDFDLVLDATTLSDGAMPMDWIEDEVTDWDVGTVVEVGMEPPPNYPTPAGGYGNDVAEVVPGMQRHLYEVTDTSGTLVGRLLVEQYGVLHREFWVIYGGSKTVLELLQVEHTLELRQSGDFIGSPSEFYHTFYYTYPTSYAAPLAGVTSGILPGCEVLGNSCS